MSTSGLLVEHAPAPRPLEGDETWNVFLSYRSVDRPWVINLYDILRSAGHKVFLDQVVLRAGDRLIAQLQDGLKKSQAGVLVWSSKSADSDWVQKEYEVMESMASRDAKFCFVPLRLDESELPLFAENRIFLDFKAYPDGPNGGELLRLLHAVVGQPLSDDSVRFAAELDQAAKDQENKINAAKGNGNADRLINLFEEGGLPWKVSSVLGCQAAHALIKLKRSEDALRILTPLEKQFSNAIRPKQLRALALLRSDTEANLSEAQEILGTLYENNERDPETVGMYARTFMDRFLESDNLLMLRRSRDLYEEAFEHAADDYYTGINAAAKSVFLGSESDVKKGREIAERVRLIVGDEPVRNDYWQSATIAEVQLILGNFDHAAEIYSNAVATAPTEVGEHERTWLQASALMEKLDPTPEQCECIRKAFAHVSEAVA